MSGVCPLCDAAQAQSLACHSCTTRIERDLKDVAAIVADLDVALSKMARIGNGGTAGLARERTPISIGAMDAGDDLDKVLTKWADAVSGTRLLGHERRARFAAVFLLSHVDDIRRHPDVVKLAAAVNAAVTEARRVVDRPADRIYLGQCMVPTQDEEGQDVTCWAEVYASPGASSTTCKACGITHVVFDRRAKMMETAKDIIVNVKEASFLLGEIGHLTVTQASIRGYIHRGKIAYRAPVDAKRFRLGDLLALLVDESERRSA